MPTGQFENDFISVFSFAHRGNLAANTPNTYLTAVGGTTLTTEISLLIPQDGVLINLLWNCQSNGLTGTGNKFIIQIGDVHASPTSNAPALVNKVVVSLDGSVTNGMGSLKLNVVAGQRVAVLVQTVTGGTFISKLRVSFELDRLSSPITWKLGTDDTTVFYDGGKVGIGTTTPTETLEVNGEVKMTRIKLIGGNPSDVITMDPAGYGRWMTPSYVPTGILGQSLKHDGTNWVADSLIYNNGTNVGIGTTSPTEKLDVIGSIKIKDGTEGAGKVLTSDAQGKASWADASLGLGIVPVGSIIAWHKSLATFTLSIDNSWVECNGQTLSDAGSLLDGEVIPNLNGEGRFLRGSATSGTEQGDQLQSHKHVEPGHQHYIGMNGTGQPGGYGAYATSYNGNIYTPHNTNPVAVQLGDPVDSITGVSIPHGNETRPINMSVVWIMRVK